jgi:hypothetical protein
MGDSMTTWMSLLLSLAVSLPLAGIIVLQLIMSAKREEQWMRIFSVKSLEIPATSMAGEQEELLKLPKPDNRKRISVPVPMPDFARNAYASMKREK